MTMMNWPALRNQQGRVFSAVMDENQNRQEPMAQAEEIAPVDAEMQETQEDETICAACRQNERDISEGKSSVLCTECRERHIKLRIPGNIKLFLVILCVVFAFALVASSALLPQYRLYAQAERHIQANEFVYAYPIYLSILEQYPDGTKLALKTANAAMQAQWFYEMSEVINNYLVGKSLSDNEYNEAMRYVNLGDAYFTSIYAVMEVADAAGESADGMTFHNGVLTLLSDPECDKATLYFYLGLTAGDADAALEYYRQAAEADSRVTYPLAYYGNTLRHTGRFDEARAVLEDALARNACDALAMRGLGILQTLEGRMEEGLQLIRKAYEIEPDGMYIRDALVVALYENGLREEAAPLVEQLEDAGEIEEDLREYLDGGIDLWEYYVKMEV